MCRLPVQVDRQQGQSVGPDLEAKALTSVPFIPLHTTLGPRFAGGYPTYEAAAAIAKQPLLSSRSCDKSMSN